MEEAKKRALTTRINSIQRFIAEECTIDQIIDKRDTWKTVFREFEQAHAEYEALITNDKDIEDADNYFTSVQQTYIDAMKAIKGYIDDQQSSDDDSIPDTNLIDSRPAPVNLPKLEIETFAGDPMKYHVFIPTFRETVEKYCDDGGARLTRLLQNTEGQAKKAIHACAVIGGDEGYKKVRDILQQRFGDITTLSLKL